MQFTIELPDNFLSYQPTDLEKELKLSIALFFFKQKKISMGKAADIIGISIYQFLEECKKHEIPAFDLSIEDLQLELQHYRESIQ